MSLVVGFDLDMTLADPRPGVVASYAALSAETGVAIDGQLAASRLGPPLETEMAHWVGPSRVDELADVYRRHFATVGIAGTTVLPGAVEALRAVVREGGTPLVITAKSPQLALATVESLDLPVADGDVVGWRWGPGKGELLAERGAAVYVGDHTGDMLAARTAGALAVGVLTGSDSRQALLDSGADTVLESLEQFPAWLSSYLLPARVEALDERLRQAESLLVAFSGGADSAFLLARATQVLGSGKVVAATAVSPSLPTAELDAARAFADDLGVRHLTPSTDELSREGYRRNEGDRCYFCKAELIDTLLPLADDIDVKNIATGTNADDAVAGFRPGINAAAERGAITPLRDAGLTKAQVRQASRDMGLVTADKPAAACLSSRIAYGVPVTSLRLSRVERAETALRSAMSRAGLSTTNLRVRDLGDRASVEVDLDVATELAGRRDVLDVVDGFERVEVDLRGFRSGSMNELLAGQSSRPAR